MWTVFLITEMLLIIEIFQLTVGSMAEIEKKITGFKSSKFFVTLAMLKFEFFRYCTPNLKLSCKLIYIR